MQNAVPLNENNVIEICALAKMRYPKINNRISDLEMYHLCQSFIFRDVYNKIHKTKKQFADKIISFAKGECVDVNDAKKINKKQIEILTYIDNIVEEYAKKSGYTKK